jgi:hypothetical protein
MRIPSGAARDAQRDIHLVLDYFGGRPGSAWRETDAKALIRDLPDVQRRCHANV